MDQPVDVLRESFSIFINDEWKHKTLVNLKTVLYICSVTGGMITIWTTAGWSSLGEFGDDVLDRNKLWQDSSRNDSDLFVSFKVFIIIDRFSWHWIYDWSWRNLLLQLLILTNDNDWKESVLIWRNLKLKLFLLVVILLDETACKIR